jgi:hypothetical protein
MVSDALLPGVKTRLTADCDTPASLATSSEVTFPGRGIPADPLGALVLEGMLHAYSKAGTLASSATASGFEW